MLKKKIVFFSCVFLLFSYPVLKAENGSVTFVNITALQNREYPFSLAVLADTAIWYATNRGLYFFDGERAQLEVPAEKFTRSFVEMMSVSAVANDDVWVLGHDPKTWTKTCFRFNGKSWNKIDFPEALPEPNDDLVIFRMQMYRNNGVTNGYAVGQNGKIYFFDGERWQDRSIDTDNTFRALLVVSADNVLVGGSGGAIYQFDGNSWRKLTFRNVDSQNYILNFSYLAPDNIWAVGLKEVWHFDGMFWQPVTGLPPTRFRDVQMISDNEGWIVTLNGEVLRFDGATWNQITGFRNTTSSTTVGSVRTGETDAYTLYIISSTGLYKSHWAKVAAF